MTRFMRSAGSGAAGALVLTLLHELVRRRINTAPRMDIVAMRGLRRLIPASQQERIGADNLFRLALVGDLVANAIYYSAVPTRTSAATLMRAAALGGAAGLGALVLPERVGLGAPPHSHTHANRAMTIAWYLAGALAAAAAANVGAGRASGQAI